MVCLLRLDPTNVSSRSSRVRRRNTSDAEEGPVSAKGLLVERVRFLSGRPPRDARFPETESDATRRSVRADSRQTTARDTITRPETTLCHPPGRSFGSYSHQAEARPRGTPRRASREVNLSPLASFLGVRVHLTLEQPAH